MCQKATQTGKCWDKIKGILRMKLCNANIHTYTSCFMEIQQKDNETLAAYIHSFQTTAKQCAFGNDNVAICTLLLKEFGMCTPLQLKFMKRTLKLWLKSSGWLKNCNTAQQVTVMLIPSMVRMMSNDDRCFVCG